MSMKLDDIEIRVLGVLIEKSMTQQASYPLTLNSITLGANQKQNREPVLALSERDVAGAVHRLQRWQLVKQAPPMPGSRSNKFEHCVVEKLHWDKRDQAVMTELMLRGRQTAGELRTRGSRMTSLPDMTAVAAVLDGLSQGDTSYVRELPREPGRAANRFEHLLAGDQAASTATLDSTSPDASVESPAGSSSAEGDVDSRLEALERRVARLEASLAGPSSVDNAVDPPDPTVV